jgi:hypothetical protein
MISITENNYNDDTPIQINKQKIEYINEIKKKRMFQINELYKKIMKNNR